MEPKDLTLENLTILIDMCNSDKDFKWSLLKAKAKSREPEKTFLLILLAVSGRDTHNNGLKDVANIKEAALNFIYKTALNQMPKYLNSNHSITQGLEALPQDMDWVPIIARWRLMINR
jgi:hypothetical protein